MDEGSTVEIPKTHVWSDEESHLVKPMEIDEETPRVKPMDVDEGSTVETPSTSGNVGDSEDNPIIIDEIPSAGGNGRDMEEPMEIDER